MESSAQKNKPAAPPAKPAASAKKSAAPSKVNQHDEAEVQAIIKKYSAIAAGASLVPVPTLDLATLVGVQVKMIQSIAKSHGMTGISSNAIKIAVSSLATTLPSGALAGAGASFLKVIPFVGNMISILASPGYYSASTYAVGQVFNSHFASGETLLSFNPQKAEAAYMTHFEAAA